MNVPPYHRILHLLQASKRLPSLTKPLHALITTLGPHPNQTFLHNNLVSLYASLCQLASARKLFDKMPHRNKASYNSMISCYGRHGCLEDAWSVLLEMLGCGFRANNFTLAGLLSCENMDAFHGVQLQGLSVKSGLLCADAFVGTSLFGLFGRCELLDEAFRVFEDMPVKSLVTWNSMISLLGNHGFGEDSVVLFRELVRENVALSESSLVGVLCGLVCEEVLESGEQVHGLVIKSGFDREVSVANSLINMYAKCARIHLAEKTFDEVTYRDVVSWNTILSALSKSKKPGKAFELFLKMAEDRMMPNQATFLSLINSCTSLQIPMYGESVHANVIKNGFETDVKVGSAFVDYYAKCNKLDDAYCCFVEIYEKNVVSWNAIILGYANKFSSASITLLLEMLQSGYRPNEFSFSAVLRSSLMLEQQQQLHCLIVKMGYENNEYVLSSLITSYGKNGLISDALVFVTAFETPLDAVPCNNIAGIYNRSGKYCETFKLLSQVDEPDIVSWNIVMAACARNGNYKELFALFKDMHMARSRPDNYTYVSVLSVCSKLCDLALGSSIHAILIKTDFSLCDTFVCNILIDMYGKCGSIDSSVKIFNSTADRNVITWTALISALGINGCANEALERFKEMEFLGFVPDKVAFTAVLTACRHGALVREAMELFEKIKNYGVEPELDHYHCVVDLLAHCGYLKEAENIISSMPLPPNALIWRGFLEGCKKFQTTEDQAVGM